MDVFMVGMGYGTGRVHISTHQEHTLSQDDSNFRLCGLGAN